MQRDDENLKFSSATKAIYFALKQIVVQKSAYLRDFCQINVFSIIAQLLEFCTIFRYLSDMSYLMRPFDISCLIHPF